MAKTNQRKTKFCASITEPNVHEAHRPRRAALKFFCSVSGHLEVLSTIYFRRDGAGRPFSLIAIGNESNELPCETQAGHAMAILRRKIRRLML